MNRKNIPFEYVFSNQKCGFIFHPHYLKRSIMRPCHLFILFYFFTNISLSAQHIITIDVEDTIRLDVDEWRGTLQWQMSYDNAAWADLPGETSDSLKYVPDQFPSYFRAKIMAEDCDPHYSETVQIEKTAPVAGLPTVVTVAPENIGTTNCVVEGNITDAGQSSVTARGIVYSTSPAPTLDDDLHIASGSGEGSFTTFLSGLEPLTTYYVRAYATNGQGTAYGEEYSFATQSNVIYSIGDEGPAGGIVYYDKGEYSDGWRYLEVSPAGWNEGGDDPWGSNFDWGCNETFVGGTSTEVGTGKENTEIILANGCMVAGTPARIAAEADINGYTDWFLPSRDELGAVYENLFYLGANFHYTYGFSTINYATSSEIDDNGVWDIGLGDGSDLASLKTNVTRAVRPIRRF